MRNLLLTVAITILSVGVSTTRADGPKHVPEKRELLAEHETIARFEGGEFRRCLGRTARCPDRCGDSGEYATFTIDEYTRYKQHGEYGGKQKSFRIQVSDFHKNAKGDPEILKTVRGLKKNERVELWWWHDYVTQNRVSSPERPITRLKKTGTSAAPVDSQ